MVAVIRLEIGYNRVNLWVLGFLNGLNGYNWVNLWVL